MSTDLAITPRNLGSILLASYCPRCLFYLLRIRFHPPFGSFGAGIFNALQRIQEAVVGHHLAQDGCLPKEFSPFCACAARVDFPKHWSKFRYVHESGVILYGVPDEIFRLRDGNLCVIDHKTARNKGNDDPFHGQYQVQVVGYANIAEIGLELGTVSKGGLLYWEVQDQTVQENTADHYEKGQVWVPFAPKPLEIKIDYAILDPLLKEANSVWKAKHPPDGRDGCKDCKKLDLLLAIERSIEAEDAQLFRTFGHFRDVQNEVCSRNYERLARSSTVLNEFLSRGDEMFEEQGMFNNWEFPDSELVEL